MEQETRTIKQNKIHIWIKLFLDQKNDECLRDIKDL